MNNKLIIFLIGFSILMFVSACSNQEAGLKLEPKAKQHTVSSELSGEVGTGWSTNENPEKAIEEAINMALEGKANNKPEFAMVFASSGSDLKKMVIKARTLLGGQAKIYGGTSDSRGAMTEKGFVKVTEKGYVESEMEGKQGVVVMLIDSGKIDFGVGAANYKEHATLSEASKAAIQDAIKSAEKSTDEKPNVVLVTPTLGNEDEAIKGIEEVLGKDVPLLGGTTGGPTFGVIGKGDEIYEEGISLAVIYTELPIGIMFAGGFDTTEEFSGIVTKVDGQGIVEIDNKPALDVYDEWLGEKIDQLYEENEPSVIRDLLTLHPLYRKYTTKEGKEYKLFSHPWPKDDTLKDRTVMTSTNIKEGERVYLSQGTWESLLNRIGNAPKEAKSRIQLKEKPLLGIGYVCGGVMGIIPEEERKKMPVLINYEEDSAPFIAIFTWGEQGYYPGLGNKHGNLQTGFLVIGQES